MSKQSIHVYLMCISAIRQVAAGHRAVAEGWTLFEQTCEEVGPGELPQLLRQLKSATTPTPTPTPGPSMPTKEEEVPMEEDVAVKQECEEINKTPIMIKLGGHKYQFKCGNCDVAPKATSRAMDAHIRSVHTKEALVCYICPFTTYNLDSLQRHEKQEHK